MSRCDRPGQAACRRLVSLCALITTLLIPSGPALATDSSPPEPVYPSVTEAPEPTPDQAPEVLDDRTSGDWIADDGRVIPGVGILTESIDQAIYRDLRTRVDQSRLIAVARQLPLDGRKIMLTVDHADAGATPEEIRQDAEATADAMVSELRTGMVMAHLPEDTDRRPRLDPGWIMLTVMVPTGSDAQEPLTVLELGEGVGLQDEGSEQRIEQAGRDLLGEELLTDSLVDLVTTAVEETTPPANTAWTSLANGRWVILASVVLLLVGIAGVPRLRRRRRARQITVHQADPSWYGSAGGDPALRLRELIEALALALDVPGARTLPSAQAALTTIVEDTVELDRVAPSSRTGRATPGWSAGSSQLQTRVQAAAELLAALLREGAESRPRVEFPDDVHQVLRSAPAEQGETS